MQTIKVAIVDDHKIFRDGIIATLEGVPSIQIVGDVASGDALLQLLQAQDVNVVLMDLHMPVKNGIEVTREVKAKFPDVKILINTMSELTNEIANAVAAGVNGYVLKTSGPDELIKALQMVAHGTNYFSPAVLDNFIKDRKSVV